MLPLWCEMLSPMVTVLNNVVPCHITRYLFCPHMDQCLYWLRGAGIGCNGDGDSNGNQWLQGTSAFYGSWSPGSIAAIRRVFLPGLHGCL